MLEESRSTACFTPCASAFAVSRAASALGDVPGAPGAPGAPVPPGPPRGPPLGSTICWTLTRTPFNRLVSSSTFCAIWWTRSLSRADISARSPVRPRVFSRIPRTARRSRPPPRRSGGDAREVLHDLAHALVAGDGLREVAGDRLDVGGDGGHHVRDLLHGRGLPHALHLPLLLGQVLEPWRLRGARRGLEDGVREECRRVGLDEAGVGVQLDPLLHPDPELRARPLERDLHHLAHLDAGDLELALPGQARRVLEQREHEVAVALGVPAGADEGERHEERDPHHGGEHSDGERFRDDRLHVGWTSGVTASRTRWRGTSERTGRRSGGPPPGYPPRRDAHRRARPGGRPP